MNIYLLVINEVIVEDLPKSMSKRLAINPFATKSKNRYRNNTTTNMIAVTII